jgi:hypothetical protein
MNEFAVIIHQKQKPVPFVKDFRDSSAHSSTSCSAPPFSMVEVAWLIETGQHMNPSPL